MMARIVVKFLNEALEAEEFFNAEVAVAAPGVFIVQNAQGQLGMFPIGAVAAVLYPEGPSRITEVSL